MHHLELGDTAAICNYDAVIPHGERIDTLTTRDIERAT